MSTAKYCGTQNWSTPMTETTTPAAGLAGILARGYDYHVQAHGPDGSHAVRTGDGSRYEVAETMAGGAISFIEHQGERFAVNVIPLARQDETGPLFTYQPRPEGY